MGPVKVIFTVRSSDKEALLLYLLRLAIAELARMRVLLVAR